MKGLKNILAITALLLFSFAGMAVNAAVTSVNAPPCSA
jgi:hypothetical protein